jgi:hypothetical protein
MTFMTSHCHFDKILDSYVMYAFIVCVCMVHTVLKNFHSAFYYNATVISVTVCRHSIIITLNFKTGKKIYIQNKFFKRMLS